LHHDSYSLAYHRKKAGPLPPPFAQVLEQQSIDFFGEPAAPVLEQLRWKAELLGSGKVRIHARLRAAAGRAQRSAGLISSTRARRIRDDTGRAVRSRRTPTRSRAHVGETPVLVRGC
jgi:hypothetical protein